jgi:hypothetical protein
VTVAVCYAPVAKMAIVIVSVMVLRVSAKFYAACVRCVLTN